MKRSRMQRKEEALSNALKHASANLDYDPDTGTDYGPMDKAEDFLSDIADYFRAFDTTEHSTIAGYAEAVADELMELHNKLEAERSRVVDLEAQINVLEYRLDEFS